MFGCNFFPYFITQLTGAFNDNLFKSAMVSLLVFNFAVADSKFLTLMAGVVFSLPFFLFSAHAGQLADKYPKYLCIKILKLIEIWIALLGAISLWYGYVPLMFLVLFLFAVHSSYYGPIKYAILPEYLSSNLLIKANAWVEAATFLAILAGTLLGVYLIGWHLGVLIIGCGCFLLAVIGFIASCKIPIKPAAKADLEVSINLYKTTKKVINAARVNKRVWYCVLGISWFWFIGSTILFQLPVYVQQILVADQTVYALLLAVISCSVGIGCQLSHYLLKDEIDGRYSGIALLIATYFMFDLTTIVPIAGEVVYDYSSIFITDWFKLVVLDYSLIAIMLGCFVVPLFAIMQHESNVTNRSRVVAGNNIVNSFFMILSPLLAMVLINNGQTLIDVIYVNAWLNVPVIIGITYLIPLKTVKMLLRFILKLFFRVKVHGLEHLAQRTQPCVVLVNHTSFLDVPILVAFLPGDYCFAINTEIAKKWWIKFPAKLMQTFALDPSNPLQTRSLIKVIKNGSSCIIFPEGRLTTTGGLMKMYEGGVMVANHSQADICCVWIDGAQYSWFSRLKGKLKQKILPNITCNIHKLFKLEIPENLKGRAKRQFAAALLQDLMADNMYKSAKVYNDLYAALTVAGSNAGYNKIVVEDFTRNTYTYKQIIVAAQALAPSLVKLQQEKIGLLLPNVANTILVLFAGFAKNIVWAMLNYSAGIKSIISSCLTSELTLILTSKAFVAKFKLEALMLELVKHDIKVVYTEDLIISRWDKFSAICSYYYTRLNLPSPVNAATDRPAVILFTSGSEGAPKGVVLGHLGIQENINQVMAVLDLNQQDKLFNALPMFHAFGLTVATFMPLFKGMYQFTYISPLHYRMVPEWVYEVSASLMIGTDTFLANYHKYAHPYDFQSLRYVFAGAEKLNQTTKAAWFDKFGIRILEGYGATETGPALALNTLLFHKAGTVGKLLPGIQYKLEPLADIGDELWVCGKNNMLGYLLADRPGKLVPLQDNWYNTGDIVKVDALGFISIIGRAKRFAKIAGEMVSLSVVEDAVKAVYPDIDSAVVAISDAKKGEKLVVCINQSDIVIKELINYWQVNMLGELSLPKKFFYLESIPRLATGKVNYPELLKLVLADMQ